MMRVKFLALSVMLFGALAGAVWWQRSVVLSWWHLRVLTAADESTRDDAARRLAGLGEDAIAPLLDALRSPDATKCGNFELGLRLVVTDWSADDPRVARTAERMHAAFASLSAEGKKAALRFAAAYAAKDDDHALPASVACQLGDMMAAAEADDDLRPLALALAGTLLERAPTGQWQASCRRLAIKGLADPNSATRLAAIQLVLREPLRKDVDLLNRVAPFLSDGEAGLRRVALLALGGNVEVVREEHLLPLLHDADLEIQHLCEVVLRSRGLSDGHVRLARLISDPSPSVRLQVIPLLRQAADLDVDVWLRRLTLDPAPAVRAAAVRFASHELSDDLRQRLGEMAQSDPSPTVREIARFYVDRASLRRVGN